MGIRINFDIPRNFEPRSYSNLGGVCGVYFLFLPTRKITYPRRDSRLIYIGMSERASNSISARLSDHFEGRSGNVGLTSYRLSDGVKLTYLNFDTIKPFWKQRIEDLESYFILDFVKNFGVYPICNNKTGDPDFDLLKTTSLEIDWSYFD